MACKSLGWSQEALYEEKQMNSIRTILHPTDFSDCSHYAFLLASTWAREHGARMVILHVIPPIDPLLAYGPAMAKLEPKQYQEKLWDVIRQLDVEDPKVIVEHRMIEGDAAKEIIRQAEETNAD